jgi:hypothetical protein
VAAEIKKFKPLIPIVMLTEDGELPVDALQSVDALVAKSAGPHFLLATVRHLLNVKPGQRREGRISAQAHERSTPFSQGIWKSIWDGTIRFAPTTKAPHE